MQAFITTMVNSYGYLGILILILVENIFPPIPSEVILTFGGFMTTYTKMNLPGVILTATLGSTLGAVILYGVGKYLSAEKLKRLLYGKAGKVLHFKPENVDRAVEWFQERGNSSVLLCRCVPIVRSLISIPAGMTGMKFRPFLLLTVIGSTIWNILLVGMGAAAGASWERIAEITHTYKDATILVAFVLAIGGLLCIYRKRLTRKKKCH